MHSSDGHEALSRAHELSRRPPDTARPERRQPKKQPGWDKQEERIAEALPGGKRTPGSGCSRRASRKSDVIGHFARAEGKTTGQKSIRVEHAFLKKIVNEALPDRLPVFVFGFDEPGKGLCTEDQKDYLMARDDWGAVRLSDLRALLMVVNAVRSGDHETALAVAERLVR